MKVFEIYFSPTGTSRRVAHAVAAALAGPDQAPIDTIDATRYAVEALSTRRRLRTMDKAILGL